MSSDDIKVGDHVEWDSRYFFYPNFLTHSTPLLKHLPLISVLFFLLSLIFSPFISSFVFSPQL
jgi:hypothetical protein